MVTRIRLLKFAVFLKYLLQQLASLQSLTSAKHKSARWRWRRIAGAWRGHRWPTGRSGCRGRGVPGFNAGMGACFLDDDLDLPASHEDGDDLCRVEVGVGAEEGLRVPHQGPSDGFGPVAGPIPDRLPSWPWCRGSGASYRPGVKPQPAEEGGVDCDGCVGARHMAGPATAAQRHTPAHITVP